MSPRTRSWSAATLAAVAMLVAGGRSTALAQLYGPTVDTTGSTCTSSQPFGITANNYCGSSAALLAYTPTMFQARYAWNLNGDAAGTCGIFQGCYPENLQFQGASATAVNNATFTAVAATGYRLTITEKRAGDMNRLYDGNSGTTSYADVGAVTATSSIPPFSGTLNLADPGSISSGNTTVNTPFDQTTTATIAGCSFGEPVTHTISFKWTGSVQSKQAEVAVRMGQQNGGTTGCAACGYAGSPARTQGLDGHFVTVSYQAFQCGDGAVDACEECDLGALNGTEGACCTSSCTAVPTNGAVCGNGIVEACEQCDDGAANGGIETCCTAECTVARPGTTCRALGGSCDKAAEQCDGVHATCPADAFYANGTTCRASGGVCDYAETCTGSSPQCPSDRKHTPADLCAFEGPCQQASYCDGTTDACPPQLPQPAGYVCRFALTHVCDVDEYCDGTSLACPPDTFKPAGTVCRPSNGPCDAEETCSGAGKDCPNNGVRPAGYVCRPAGGVCDVAETCTGFSGGCPANAFVSSTTVCRAAAGPCDVAENCTGTTANCPTDAFAPSTIQCRAAAGVCDVAESCPGNAASCPADVKSTAQCRASSGVCDVAESCNGVSNDCPTDGFAAATQQCRASAGVCDVAEHCTGTSANCGADAKSTAACRASAGGCDAAETCDGVSDDCPADALEPATTECRASAGVCDLAENCTGTSGDCPADAKSAAVCRASAGVCDVAETCDGVTDDCPADALEPATTECRGSAGVCDLAESCTGTDASCPADAKSAAQCRASAGACDVAESCDGVDDDCPGDAFEPATTACRGSAGVCDVAESCTGSSAPCPPDAFEPATIVCRSAASDCDADENCTGSSAACPIDSAEPDGTPCSDGITCTVDDGCSSGTCSGSSITCGNGVVESNCSEQCDDGNTTSGDGCSATCQNEFVCGSGPQVGCKLPIAPAASKIQLKDKTPDTADSLGWKWTKGAATTLAELGTPTSTTDYLLCIYDEGRGLVLSAFAPAQPCGGTPCWSAKPSGFKYRDSEATPDGITGITLKAGAAGKATIILKGKGANLQMPPLSMMQPVTVQLRNSDGMCWEARYSAPATKNDSIQYKDKSD